VLFAAIITKVMNILVIHHEKKRSPCQTRRKQISEYWIIPRFIHVYKRALIFLFSVAQSTAARFKLSHPLGRYDCEAASADQEKVPYCIGSHTKERNGAMLLFQSSDLWIQLFSDINQEDDVSALSKNHHRLQIDFIQ